jgi:hypothetical protein
VFDTSLLLVEIALEMAAVLSMMAWTGKPVAVADCDAEDDCEFVWLIEGVTENVG